jgi:hypothetical protein
MPQRKSARVVSASGKCETALGVPIGTICMEDDDEGKSEPDEGEVVKIYEQEEKD